MVNRNNIQTKCGRWNLLSSEESINLISARDCHVSMPTVIKFVKKMFVKPASKGIPILLGKFFLPGNYKKIIYKNRRSIQFLSNVVRLDLLSLIHKNKNKLWIIRFINWLIFCSTKSYVSMLYSQIHRVQHRYIGFCAAENQLENLWI